MSIGLQEYVVTRTPRQPGPKDVPAAPRKSARGKAGWAEGLRNLYGQVVDEPLPDSFTELLRKLDQASDE